MKNMLIEGHLKRMNILCEESFRADKALLFAKLGCGIPAKEELRAVISDLEYLADIEIRYSRYYYGEAGFSAGIGEDRALAELRFNPYHDPANGQFATANSGGGLTEAGISDKIKNELKEAINSGKISTKLHKGRQGAHRKGNPEYEKRVDKGEHPSYVTVSNMEIQKIINEMSGTGKIHIIKGHYTETIERKENWGVCVERYTGKETPTNRGTIHYSKDGAHLVPSNPARKDKKSND